MPWPLRVLVIVGTVTGCPATVWAQTPASSPRNASYTLQATLTPTSRTIEGRGRLTWRNTARIPATELRFHTYWNAWRDRDSTWFREQRLALARPFGDLHPEDAGQIDVTGLSIVRGQSQEDVLPQARYVAPDDGNERDQTVLAVPLDQPIAPGEVVDIDLAWTARVPRTVSRTGVLGRYYFIAQWFPKIGVYEDTGWNCRQFHAATEFFADYGVYDVSLTVPAGWIVGATGVEDGRTVNRDGTATHRYVQADVHDFAWTTSPDFVDVTRRIETQGLPPVTVRLLLQPEHVSQLDRHLTTVREALGAYTRWFGPYPYGHFTVVDPVTIVNARAQGNDTGGMEYPTLITAGTHWIAPSAGTEPESVVVHETGHQYWQGVVATNEVDHAWMDEGLTTYAAARVLAEAFPSRFAVLDRYFGGLVAWPSPDVPWSRDINGNRLLTYRAAPGWDTPATPSWRYWPGTARSVTYAKTALWLTSLERLIGSDRMQRVLSTFFARYAFRHPSPTDFFATASEVSGEDLTWFFDAVYRQASSFDYAVGQVSAEAVDGGQTRSTVILRRLGDGVFPVRVRIQFDDGTTTLQPWNGQPRWHAMTFLRAARLRSVEIDPDRVLTLDLNWTNNSWAAQPKASEAATTWALRWLTWMQSVLLTYAFFV